MVMLASELAATRSDVISLQQALGTREEAMAVALQAFAEASSRPMPISTSAQSMPRLTETLKSLQADCKQVLKAAQEQLTAIRAKSAQASVPPARARPDRASRAPASTFDTPSPSTLPAVLNTPLSSSPQTASKVSSAGSTPARSVSNSESVPKRAKDMRQAIFARMRTLYERDPAFQHKFQDETAYVKVGELSQANTVAVSAEVLQKFLKGHLNVMSDDEWENVAPLCYDIWEHCVQQVQSWLPG